MEQTTRNEVELCGVITAPAVFSHENHDVPFYLTYLSVPRLSGQTDVLPLLLRGSVPIEVSPGAGVQIAGQLRSFNNKSGQGRRLVLTVYVRSLAPWDGEPVNRVILSGTVCKPPVLRRTPLGRSICDVMLAAGRRYGRADYLPVIIWGQLAQTAACMTVGDRLALEGRFQSRAYTKVLADAAQQRTAYEVSCMRLLPSEE